MGKFVVFLGGHDFVVHCEDEIAVMRLYDRFENLRADPKVIVDITERVQQAEGHLEGPAKLEHEVKKSIGKRKGKLTPLDRAILVLQETVAAGKDGISVAKLAKMVGRKPQGFGPSMKPAFALAESKGHNFYHYITVAKVKGKQTYFANRHTNTLLNGLMREQAKK